MEKQEQFNPRDEKYKKVADLPEDQQQNFADTENGGFVKKEVLESDEGLKTEAERRNKERPVLQKLRGQNKQSFVEIAQEEAMETDKIIEKEKLAPLEAALQESFELNFMQRGI